MMSAVLDHLWQSTLFAGAILIMALVFRRTRAAVRYGLWFAASAKFLIPFAALGLLGRLLTPAMRPPLEARAEAALIAQAVQPFSLPDVGAPAAPAAHAVVQAAAPTTMVIQPSLLLLALWILGCAAVLAIWFVRWTKVRAAVRGGASLTLAAPMPVLASPWMREPGLVGLFRPVLLVPETLLDHLKPAEISALVAHEACHLRRKDNLTGAIHMLVEALFWFHPLVWWIGARLIDERERACDEAVVGAGHDPAVYALSLVECSRLYLQSPLTCVAGASGSYLLKRVEMIMTSSPLRPLSHARKAVLVAASACALATPVAAGWLMSPPGEQAAARALGSIPADFQPTRRQPVPAVAHGPELARATGPHAPGGAQIIPSVMTSDARSTEGAAGPATGDLQPNVALAPLASLDVARPGLMLVSRPEPFEGGLPVVAAAPADVGTMRLPLLSDPVWVRRPTLQAIDRVYPPAADRERRPGRASMRCRADDRGYLSRCAVLTEWPEGLGFGKAALYLQTEYKLRTLDGAGTPVQGHLVDVTVDFTPRFWAKVAGDGEGQVVRWTTDPLGSPYGKARYPWEAMQKGVAAHVALSCVVQADGHLADCEVARESPKGMGFGRMALLSKTQVLQVETRARDGSPMAGRRVEVDYVFNPPCNAMADSNQVPCPASGGEPRGH